MYDELLDESIAIPESIPTELPSVVRSATLWLLVELAFLYAPFDWDILSGPTSGTIVISIYGVLLLISLLFSVGVTSRAVLHGNWLLRTYATLHIGAWLWGLAFFIIEGTFVHMVGIALGGSLLMILAEYHRQYTPEPWFWKGLLFITGIHLLENGTSAILVGYESWQMQAARTVSILLYVGVSSYTLYQLLQYGKARQFLRLYTIGSLLLAWIIAGIWHSMFHYQLKNTFDPITLDPISYWTYPLIGRLPIGCWVLYVVGLVAALGARRLKIVPFDYPE